MCRTELSEAWLYGCVILHVQLCQGHGYMEVGYTGVLIKCMHFYLLATRKSAVRYLQFLVKKVTANICLV